MTRVSLAVLVVASAAWAEAPVVALAPVKQAGIELAADDVRTVAERALLAAGAVTSDTALTQAAVAAAAADCGADDACLKAFALQVKAMYALHFSVAGDGASLIVEGRVVRDDGPRVAGPTTVKVARDGKDSKPALKEALNELFKGLGVGQLPSTRVAIAAVEPKPAVAAPEPTPAPAQVPVVKVAERAPGAGVPLLVAGLGTAAVGAVLATVAYAVHAKELTPCLDSNGMPVASGARCGTFGSEPNATRDAHTAGLVVVGVGGAVAIVGGILLVASGSPPPAAQVSVAPINGGAVVGLSGALP